MSTPVVPPAGTHKLPTSLHGNDEPVVERRTLRDYVIILRERLWIALPVALLAAVSIGYYKAQETPLYQAAATMQFKRADRVVQIEGPTDTSLQNEIDLNTRLNVMNSALMKNRVYRAFTPDEIKILQRPFLADLAPGQTPPLGGALLGSITVGSIRNSFIITVTCVHRSGEAAALVANKFVETYVQYLLEGSTGVNESAIAHLRNRAEELRRESEAAANKLQDYKRRHNLVDLDNNVGIVGERLKAINGKLTAVRLERLNLEVLLRQIEQIKAAGGQLTEVAYISGYGTIPALRAQLAELLKTQSVLSERYLERHPRMIDLANSITAVEDQIARNVEQSVADLRTQIANIVSNEASYEKESREAQQEQLRLGELSVEFNSLQQQANVAENNYRLILDRLNQMTTVVNIDNIPVTPLDPAHDPGGPFTPNIRAIVRSSLMLGVLVFGAVAVGLSFLDDRVKSAWDIEGFIGAHLLGIIPELGDVPDSEKHSLVTSNKTSPGSEAFLGVYSSVKIQSKLDFPKSILVTSTIPGEGKTMISCNLAGAFARHGRRVLIIDCDMRRPMLHRHFKLTNEAGLIAWFEAGAKIPGDPLTDPSLGISKLDENLYLLRSGGRSKSPTELLENPLFGQFLDSLKHHFDLVVVDSPPMGAVTDALLIAERTDEVIYVCRFNRAYRKHIRLYIKQIKESKNELLGVVLNGLSPRRIEYYSNYRYYRSYKKYYGSQS